MSPRNPRSSSRRGRRVTTLCMSLLTVVVLAPPAHASSGHGARLRVMSYNIHAGAGDDNVFDLERQAEAIEAQRPDVVGLQEVDVDWSTRSDYTDEATWLARRLHMRVFFAPIYDLPPDRPGAPDRRFGIAVLSRFPILRAENHEITRLSTQVPNPVPAPAPGFPEVLIKARGARVWVYATHLDYRSDPAVRKMQVADMIDIMSARRGPKILVGDFNAEPDATELAPLWTRLTDALTAVGQRMTPTWPAGAPRDRIDYVTYSPGVRAKDAFVPDTLASDHRPVVADLGVNR